MNWLRSLSLCCLLPLAAQELTVAAAADLFPLEAELTRLFRLSGGGGLRWTFGSSGMLARQIENGAPYDIYLSANEGFVKDLARTGQIQAGAVALFAFGRVGLWSPAGKVKALADLTTEANRHIAIPNPRHAPYGMAAEQILRRHGLWERLQPRLVLAENVRQAFEYARTGNADAAITSWTLLLDKNGILLPAEWHAPIRQTAGIVSASPRREEARRFLDFLLSAPAQSLLRKYGFGSPR
jgi:molybdate transport system substrate-binding protein